MKRSTTQDSGGDAALRELERALDAFMATHTTTAANSLATASSRDSIDEALDFSGDDDDSDGDNIVAPTQSRHSSEVLSFHRDLRRLQILSSVITGTRRRRVSNIVSVGKLLLAWLQTVENSNATAVTASPRSASGALPLSSSADGARTIDQTPHQSPADPVASWLVAVLMKISLTVSQDEANTELSSSDRAALDELAASVVSRCLLAFQRAWQAEEEVQRRLRAESSGNLFSYFTMRKPRAKPQSGSGQLGAVDGCLACITEAANVWSHVMGLAALLAPDISRLKLQKEVLARTALWNATKLSTGSGDNLQHPYLKHLAQIRLGLAVSEAQSNSDTLASRMAEAARWLRVVMPLMLKPHRSHLRCASAQLLSQMLIRELYSLTRRELNAVYTSTGSDWSRCVSDIHAAALRLTDSAKKKSRSRAQQQLEAAAWSLRVVILALAPGEIFTRYWHEDATVLLRLQHHLNQDSNAGGASSYNVLPSLDMNFTYMMHRHFLLRDSGSTNAKSPSESDCMEIINTTQAWAFFSLPRLRPNTSGSSGSFVAFRTTALPALVHISRGIASYNTTYTIQSHLRRLLAEPVGIGDPQKLIGLEALLDLLSCPGDNSKSVADDLGDFHVNDKDLLSNRQTIGELVGRVLLECSTRIGHKLLTEIPITKKGLKRSDTRYDDGDDGDDEYGKDPAHAVSVATFAAALGLMPPLYAHLALSGEQKLLLLVRASVNAERVIYRRAHEVLLALVGPLGPNPAEPPPPGAITVVRALTDYIMRMSVNNSAAVSDAAGAITILRLLSVLLEPTREAVTRWESPRAKYEALIQVEAVAVYLLARGDDNIQAEQLLRFAALDALEVAHEARVAYSKQPAAKCMNMVPLLGRPSVWTILGELDSELQRAFYSFGPGACQDATTDKSANEYSLVNLQRLVCDTCERHSFRWSLGLARIFRRLVRRAPDVTAYIWADVADKVAKLEPVIAVTPTSGDLPQQQNQRELARWRNLALLATSSASPILHVQARKTEGTSSSSECSTPSSSIAPSVAPSAMVASLARQLASYLRSTNIGQRNAAILALGHAGTTVLSTVLDALARYEVDAFTIPSSGEEQESVEAGSTSQNALRTRSIKTTRFSRKKLLEMQHAQAAQLTLQWALGRCYRLLLENRTREGYDEELFEPGGPMGERLRQTTTAFLVKMVTAFESVPTAPSDNYESGEGSMTLNSISLLRDANPCLLMAQLDFVAILRALLLHSNSAARSELQLPQDKIAGMLLGWCGQFSKELANRALADHLRSGFVAPENNELYTHWTQLCDVHAARDGNLVFPWIWVDNQEQLLGTGSSTTIASRRVAQYFLCHRVFSTLAEVLRSSLKSETGLGSWDGDSVMAWLDACFSVDVVAFPHFSALHLFAQRALHALLELPPGSARFNNVVKRCLEKATCAFPSTGQNSQLQVARQYLSALSASVDVTSYFRSLLLRLQDRRGDVQDKGDYYLAVQLLYVLLLHVGVHQDGRVAQDHRQVALNMVAAIVCASDADCDDEEAAAARWGLQGYYSPSLVGQVAGRLQVSVSALLASKFSVLSLRVSLVVLRAMQQTSLNNREGIAQQRQMLAAVLPWLAEVPLWKPIEVGSKPTELLELLFSLTSAHGESCGDQIDHIWLTLAFASSGVNDSNLKEIVGFLFRQQQNSQLPSETAKTIMWWLCRWQDAALDVLRLLLLQLPLSVADTDHSKVPTAFGDLGAIVMLASDTGCHLIQSGGGSASADVRDLAVHLIHISLTTLFALLDDDTVDENTSKCIAQHCHVLLHSILPLLEAPRGLLAAALALIQTATTTCDATRTKHGENAAFNARDQFHEALRALAVCLSTTEAQVWSELCVREIAVAISLEAPSSLESSAIPKQLSPPHEVCVRFALVAYTHLSPRFQGDILLSALTLLRQTLTASVGDRQNTRSQSLAQECLVLIAKLTRSMPVPRLVLYPQVFWVALALLTHCRQHRGTSDNISSLHDSALELLATLWDRTPFMTHNVAQDLILCTRPAQWESSTARNSVLLEVIRCLYINETPRSRALAMAMLHKAVVLVPRDLLGVDSHEHLIICTLGLLPALIIPLRDINDDCTAESCVWDDLLTLWEAWSTCTECNQVVELLANHRPVRTEQKAHREFAEQFMIVFVPALVALELDHSAVGDLNGLSLAVEVIVASLPLPASSLDGEVPLLKTTRIESNDIHGDFIFVLLEEFLREVQRHEEKTAKLWRPTPELEALLARLLRSPRSERQWRASVRVLSCISEIANLSATSTGPAVSPLPVSRQVRRSLPGGKTSELSTTQGWIDETEGGDPLGNSATSYVEAADASTLKQNPSTRVIQQRTSPRSQSSGSILRHNPSEGSNNSDRSKPPLAKSQRSSEQSANEHEPHVVPSDSSSSASIEV